MNFQHFTAYSILKNLRYSMRVFRGPSIIVSNFSFSLFAWSWEYKQMNFSWQFEYQMFAELCLENSLVYIPYLKNISKYIYFTRSPLTSKIFLNDRKLMGGSILGPNFGFLKPFRQTVMIFVLHNINSSKVPGNGN